MFVFGVLFAVTHFKIEKKTGEMKTIR